MISIPFSVVIPVYNESESVRELLSELTYLLDGSCPNYEILFVDDASTDETHSIIQAFKNENSKIKIIKNTKNLGQGATVLKGIKEAKFGTVVTMDGDLQVDPNDILILLNLKISAGFDFVCSRRQKRKGENFVKNLPSIIGNFLISLIFNTEFIDIGSSLKVLNKSDVDQLEPFRNIHRYFNIILAKKNKTYNELLVVSRRRKYGKSNYSIFKFLKVFLEIRFLYKYLKELK